MQIKKLRACILMAMFIAGLVICVTPVACSSSEWTLVAERGVKAYPDLTETVWQKVPIALPNGPYDRIGLHRLIKAGIEPLGVLFICPGTWSSAEQLISNPPEDSYVKDENHTQSIYWANRGFDVYAIDYRTHFVPITKTTAELSFMADWGWDQWISDIKEAVDMAKEVSGAERIYIAGQSFGGIAAMNFATLYGKQDLKGLIMLDAAAAGLTDGLGIKNPFPTNSYNLTAAIELMNLAGAWGYEVNNGQLALFKYADQFPSAPAPYPYNFTFPNITAFLAYVIYYSSPPWGTAGISNIFGGYGDARVVIHTCATFDRYWPNRLGLEITAYTDWTNCPYVTNDFDDHYSDIDVPLLAFQSQFFGNRVWGPFQDGIANPDFSTTILLGYGHLDVFSGVYSARDVSGPTYNWMVNRRMLVGCGGIRIGGKWTCGETTIYINLTVIDFKVDGVRVPWNIVDHRTYKNLESYKGEGELGSIAILIYKEYAAAAGPKAFFLGQRV